ncbi:FAD-binding oxidoreductase [Acuticoccus kandeliae]|uniref:FAD-binding oxidoreductase n=1 Tax=Acuticoccus kandeliae TaxID=2073160 RepID=UPI0013007C93|nr:FAD-binding oxidoreductase [Acuticoccus kandeliae]
MPAPIFPNIVGPVLPFGAGNSYGDSCMVEGGRLIDSRPGAMIRQFDPHNGRLVADAGVTLGAVLRLIGPRYTLHALPGTCHVTLGGAVANDIHGRNHHRRGSFGAAVEALTLRRSDQPGRLRVRPGDPLFDATIGGMGMTGLIETVTLRCMRVPSTDITQSTIPFTGLEDGLALVEEAAQCHEYVLAWVDALSNGAQFGRGKLIIGDHAPPTRELAHRIGRAMSVPFTPPIPVVSALTVRAYNALQHRGLPPDGTTERMTQEAFTFPFDRFGEWNRLFGPRGLHQHQTVIPFANARKAIAEMIAETHGRREYSSHAAIRVFGKSQSPGLMSFARRGISLTLDFPNHGKSTEAMLDRLDAIALSAGGAVNPSQDRRMSAETFARSMPDWHLVDAVRDPLIVSDFWRRTAMHLDVPTSFGRAA